MKKKTVFTAIATAALSAALCFGLAACGEDEDNTDKTQPDTGTQTPVPEAKELYGTYKFSSMTVKEGGTVTTVEVGQTLGEDFLITEDYMTWTFLNDGTVSTTSVAMDDAGGGATSGTYTSEGHEITVALPGSTLHMVWDGDDTLVIAEGNETESTTVTLKRAEAK